MTQPPESKFCQTAQELILSQLDEQPVSPADETTLARHLADCPHCRAYQQAMEKLIHSVRSLKSVSVPAGLEERIMESIRHGASEIPARDPKPWFAQMGLKKALPVAATLLLLAVGVSLLGRLQEAPPSGPDAYSNSSPVAYQPVAPLPENGMQPPPFPEAGPNTGGLQNVAVSQQRDGAPGAWQPAHNPPQPAVVASGGARNVPHLSPQAGRGADAPVDTTELASAPVMDTDLHSAFAAEDEGDVYYDPVSMLVGF